MFFSAPRFKDLVPQFIAFQQIYSEDRRTTPSNLRILERHLGELKLSQIGAPQIEALLAARLKEGIGRATLNRNRATLSRFFTWAITRGMHPGPNPVKEVQKFRESRGRTRYLSMDEAARLVLACSPHLKPIVTTALHTGGRLGEILKLRWRDVDLEVGIVTFRKETTKARKERIVPVSQDLAQLLRGMKRRQPDETLFAFRGEGLRSIRTAFENARHKAGLDDLHFHDLRHTFASWYVQNGGDIYVLQNYLGHTSIQLTQRYAHVSRALLQQGVRFIGPPRSPMRQSEKSEV